MPHGPVTMESLFGRIRSVLQDSAAMRTPEVILGTLVLARAMDEPRFIEQWLPYLASFPLPEFTAVGRRDLQRLHQVLPDNAPRVFRPERDTFTNTKAFEALLNDPAIGPLTTLDLSEMGGRIPFIIPLVRTRTFAALKSLNLSTTSLFSDDGRALSKAPFLPKLTHLDLSRNRLFSGGTIDLLAPNDLHALRSLDLSVNQMTFKGAEAIATAESLSSLERLELRGNAIADDGIAVLAQSPNFSRLIHLDLTQTSMTSAGALHLASSESFPRLELLNLKHNDIGKDARQALERSETLPAGCKVVTRRGSFVIPPR